MCQYPSPGRTCVPPAVRTRVCDVVPGTRAPPIVGEGGARCPRGARLERSSRSGLQGTTHPRRYVRSGPPATPLTSYARPASRGGWRGALSAGLRLVEVPAGSEGELWRTETLRSSGPWHIPHVRDCATRHAPLPGQAQPSGRWAEPGDLSRQAAVVRLEEPVRAMARGRRHRLPGRWPVDAEVERAHPSLQPGIAAEEAFTAPVHRNSGALDRSVAVLLGPVRRARRSSRRATPSSSLLRGPSTPGSRSARRPRRAVQLLTAVEVVVEAEPLADAHPALHEP